MHLVIQNVKDFGILGSRNHCSGLLAQRKVSKILCNILYNMNPGKTCIHNVDPDLVSLELGQ